MFKRNLIKNNKLMKGFSLLETLIYIGVLVLVLFIVINTTLMMFDSYSNIKMSQRINQTASGILERVVVETKWSRGLAVSGNVFNSDLGALVLSVVDDAGNFSEKKFFLEDGNLKMMEGADIVTLNLPGVSVDKFYLNLVDTGVSKLIKIEIDLSSQRKDVVRNETFYNSVVMREIY
ncbi:TPA: hypothetical protein DCZ46_00825 [Candidatus Campbellbacteria bacterium]|nr:MAG: seg [Candidatus Campbellbacteria bacterium GW2011_OD1_34_28]KKP75371.1 MAG: hypothetical protein UR74_C0001G0227 [Candidatus Campbellbacteria bacterium GW2011_GWD2_35_24]KKP76068.1 MAG: hypothetical protein UR75_C0001G0102 [Candidatus Campbellbacteria bacterium GW2011_GWC2_35_28]KKP77257.1 MAG: hypothetical protein UR76_C0001G0102 [Candidatus Campbellbacteria bacterium GW2011_GWC1_35_31]KKP79186.1 MAG: hypothetical protein UR79_C0001G0102 [Candidatus Campbellbacteria bacterium GW2011_GW